MSRSRYAAPLVLALAVCLGPLAAAAAPDYTMTDVAAVREITFRSAILDEERTLLVRVPQAYDDGVQRYPVLLMLDAEWHFTTAAADVELLSECSYVQPHPALPVIVVGVVNTDRNRDFTPTNCPKQAGMGFPTSGGDAAFRRFLVEEALPVVDDALRTCPYRILAGWSLGGLFTLDTLLFDGDAFDAYLAISPSLWWDDGWTLRQLQEEGAKLSPDAPRKLCVTLGSVEKERASMVARAVAAFTDHLDAAPLPHLTMELVPLEGMGHNFSPKVAYFYGLATIFADLSLPAPVRDEGLDAVDAYYADLSSRYKTAVAVPEDVYGSLAWKLFESGDGDAAGAVFRAWVARHPDSSVAMASLGSFCREIGDGERAVALFRAAIAAEQKYEYPRQDFIGDLSRDIDALRAED